MVGSGQGTESGGRACRPTLRDFFLCTLGGTRNLFVSQAISECPTALGHGQPHSQGDVGNQLLWTALFLLLSIFKAPITLEHPKGCGTEVGKWSIWGSSFIQQLLLSESIRIWTFLQGPLGQPFAKPANVLAGRLDNLGAAPYAGYNRCWRPTMKLKRKAGREVEN